MTEQITTIDGSQGEGGGQILRSSLALAAITKTPIRVINIRAKRRKPGLLRQHLTAVRAAAAISGAQLRGDSLGASELEFRPGPIVHGNHRFSVGSAGSAMLVFQTVLWPLAHAPGRSRVVFEGGTHNPMAPPFEFVERAFAPVIRELGVRLDFGLERPGFYPAGGGRFWIEIEGGAEIGGLALHERGAIRRVEALAMVARLPVKIGKRELTVVRRELGWAREDCRVVELESVGPGNALCLCVEAEGVTEVVTGFGDKGVRAEAVAGRAVDELRRWLAAEVPVGEHLADQLLLPLALAAAGEGRRASSFTTVALSSHTRTNAEIIARFLPVRFELQELDSARARVSVTPA